MFSTTLNTLNMNVKLSIDCFVLIMQLRMLEIQTRVLTFQYLLFSFR